MFSQESIHTIDEIKAKWEQYKPVYTDDDTKMIEQARLTPPYSTGKVTPMMIRDGVKMLNFMRYVAGLPDDVETDENLNYRAQCLTLVSALNGYNSHVPEKPAGMDEEIYRVAKEDGLKCNLDISNNKGWYYKNLNNPPMRDKRNFLSLSIIDYAADNAVNNITRVGHRRNILRPKLKKTGFGFISIETSSIENDKVEFEQTQFSSNHVGDASRTSYPDWDFITWPCRGYFPTVFFKETLTPDNYPYSIAVNGSKYKIPNVKELTVEVVRTNDQMTWRIDKSNYMDEETYGGENSILRVLPGSGYWPATILFTLDLKASYHASDRYQVTVKGITDLKGIETPLQYSVEFFDLPSGLAKPVVLEANEDKKETVTETVINYGSVENGKAILDDQLGDVANSFIDITGGMIEQKEAGSLYCEISLAEIPPTLLFNSAEIEENAVEYDWAFNIDLDGNGENDYSISLNNFKLDGSQEAHLSIAKGCARQLYKISGQSASTVGDVEIQVKQKKNTLQIALNQIPDDLILTNNSKISIRSEYFKSDKVDYAP